MATCGLHFFLSFPACSNLIKVELYLLEESVRSFIRLQGYAGSFIFHVSFYHAE